MIVVAGPGGARLKGATYSEGTRLIARADGSLVQQSAAAGTTSVDTVVAPEGRTNSWPLLDDAKFAIRYPPGWRIRERGETDDDGVHFTFNDPTTRLGGMGVSLLKRRSVFGSQTTKPDVATATAMLRRLVQVDAMFVKEFARGPIKGRQFTARQTINGQAATWRLDLIEMDATYVALVFGFYRPANPTQQEQVETALNTFELRPRR
jgi:hypothetical protein